MGKDSDIVVDTSDAADSFMAGLVNGCLQGWDVRKSANFANAVAAHQIRHNWNFDTAKI